MLWICLWCVGSFYTTRDHQICGGNAGLDLAPDELLLAFPYDRLGIAVANLPRICRTSSMRKFTLFHER